MDHLWGAGSQQDVMYEMGLGLPLLCWEERCPLLARPQNRGRASFILGQRIALLSQTDPLWGVGPTSVWLGFRSPPNACALQLSL